MEYIKTATTHHENQSQEWQVLHYDEVRQRGAACGELQQACGTAAYREEFAKYPAHMPRCVLVNNYVMWSSQIMKVENIT